jgi:thioredoxin 1
MTNNSEFNTRRYLESLAEPGNGLVILAFRADWSGSCEMMEPMLQTVSASFQGKVKIVGIDIDQDRWLAKLFQITTVPSFFFVKNGKVVDQISSLVRREDFEEIIAKYITNDISSV